MYSGDATMTDVRLSVEFSSDTLSSRSSMKISSTAPCSQTPPCQQPKSGSGHKRPVRCRNVSIISMFAVIIAAVTVTIVVLMLVKKDKEDGPPGELPPQSPGNPEPVYGRMDMEVTVTNRNYSAALDDPTSDTYTQTSSNFCAEIEKKYNTSGLQQNDIRCEVTKFYQGSVIVYFSVIVVSVDNVLPKEDKVEAVLISGNQMGMFDLNQSTIIVGPMTLLPYNPINCGTPTWNNADIEDVTTTTATCKPGFDGGSSVITCDSDMNWVGGPDCTRVDCGAATWANADISDRTGTIYGSTATATCRVGFNVGSQEITCGANRVWAGGPDCRVIDCRVPKWQDAEISSVTTTTYQSTATATCKLGFDGGPAVITCDADGHWVRGPACTRVDCGVAIWQDAVISVATGRTFESKATATCKEVGFSGGSSVITCDVNGNWVGGPTCVPVDCGVPVWAEADISDLTTTTFWSKAKAMCKSGYNGGSAELTCGSDGKWRSGPYCTPVDCGAAAWENADISDLTGTTYGSIAAVTCRAGFAGGSDEIMCDPKAVWVGGPDCRLIINGGWSDWSMLSPCSVTCGSIEGTRGRSRTCTNPPPANGGTDCVGGPSQTETCLPEIACPAIDLSPQNPRQKIGTFLEITCEKPSANGLRLELVTHNGTDVLATVTGNKLTYQLYVGCDHTGTIVCAETSGGDQTSTQLVVFKNPTTPVLTLPLTMVVGLATGSGCKWCSEKEDLRCQADLGYPHGYTLDLETDVFGSWESLALVTPVNDDVTSCSIDRTAFWYSVNFPQSYNGTHLRCAVKTEHNTYVVGYTSEPLEVQLVSDTACKAWDTTEVGSDVFFQHPFVCTSAVWCGQNRIHTQDCSPNCPVFSGTNLSHCFGTCTTC